MSSTNIIYGTINLALGILLAVLGLPLFREQLRKNNLLGKKQIPEADRKMFMANRYGARRLIFWSEIMIALGIAAFFANFNKSSNVVIFSLAPLIVIIPAVETYLHARNLK